MPSGRSPSAAAAKLAAARSGVPSGLGQVGIGERDMVQDVGTGVCGRLRAGGRGVVAEARSPLETPSYTSSPARCSRAACPRSARRSCTASRDRRPARGSRAARAIDHVDILDAPASMVAASRRGLPVATQPRDRRQRERGGWAPRPVAGGGGVEPEDTASSSASPSRRRRCSSSTRPASNRSTPARPRDARMRSSRQWQPTMPRWAPTKTRQLGRVLVRKLAASRPGLRWWRDRRPSAGPRALRVAAFPRAAPRQAIRGGRRWEAERAEPMARSAVADRLGFRSPSICTNASRARPSTSSVVGPSRSRAAAASSTRRPLRPPCPLQRARQLQLVVATPRSSPLPRALRAPR